MMTGSKKKFTCDKLLQVSNGLDQECTTKLSIVCGHSCEVRKQIRIVRQQSSTLEDSLTGSHGILFFHVYFVVPRVEHPSLDLVPFRTERVKVFVPPSNLILY
jgi:hypothetical protein